MTRGAPLTGEAQRGRLTRGGDRWHANGMQIGFVGLGRMGRAIARNLLRGGHAVTVWNRTRSRAEELAAEGARVADTPADAARGAELFIDMLADDAAVEAVILGEGGGVHALARGTIHAPRSASSRRASRSASG